ncbi:MAG TPA: hypothetical protein VFF82_08260 [Rhodocyclaceae bacterium]|nr:hypothetical protein [Rhodocyclaceae bacterium]
MSSIQLVVPIAQTRRRNRATESDLIVLSLLPKQLDNLLVYMDFYLQAQPLLKGGCGDLHSVVAAKDPTYRLGEGIESHQP